MRGTRERVGKIWVRVEHWKTCMSGGGSLVDLGSTSDDIGMMPPSCGLLGMQAIVLMCSKRSTKATHTCSIMCSCTLRWWARSSTGGGELPALLTARAAAAAAAAAAVAGELADAGVAGEKGPAMDVLQAAGGLCSRCCLLTAVLPGDAAPPMQVWSLLCWDPSDMPSASASLNTGLNVGLKECTGGLPASSESVWL